MAADRRGKLQLALLGLVGRVSNELDFRELEATVFADAGGAAMTASVQARPADRPGRLEWRSGGTRENIEPGELPARLLALVGEAPAARITCTDRVSTLEITIRGDQVTISNRQTAHDAEVGHSGAALEGPREWYLAPGEADPVLKALGLMSPDGKIRADRRRKYRQIDHFIELLDPLLRRDWPRERVELVDCGCGKSYLSFAINYYLREKLRTHCFFSGLDSNAQVVETASQIARQLGYRNMRFIATDIQTYRPDNPVDVVLSLHACDTATDAALAAGIAWGAELIVVVPCCQTELYGQLDPGLLGALLEPAVYRRRFADLLTDALRTLFLEAHGYRTSVVEYVSPLDTPKNIMLRAEKVSRDNRSRQEEYLRYRAMFGVDPAVERFFRARQAGGRT